MTSPAHNPCVPVVDPPALPTIPRVDTFRGNTIPGGGAAHVGIGLSEAFLNHAGYGMFDSGLLCLGAGTRTSQQLSTGLFSLLITSIRSVTYPQTSAPMAIAVRPQLPPVFEIGAGTATEALLTVTLPDLELDFYVWSTERYVRILTYRADLGIPINLRVESGAIVPEITMVSATDSSVTNSDLLTEDPAMLAGTLETIISMFAGMLTGGLSPISLPDLMGFELMVPDGGIVGVTDSGEEFLGIFANLAIASGAGTLVAEVDTHARIDDVRIDPNALRLETFAEGETPRVRVVVDPDGPAGVEYEHSYRLDGLQWSPWMRGNVLDIEHHAFLLQARHELLVRSRAVGYPDSVDLTPAELEVLVDILAPFVEVARTDTGATITASDVISPREGLELRYRIDDGAWTEWQALPETAFVPLAHDDSEIDVEVRDESGNVGSARAAIIRGLPNPMADSGCSCETPGSGPGAPLFGLGLLVAFGLYLRRRTR
jgi:MYXO-CTERM domain-containing protein